jgi:hypothetical protein
MMNIYRNETCARLDAQAIADMYGSATLYINDVGNYSIAAEGEIADTSHGERPVAQYKRGFKVPARVVFNVTIA